MEHFKQQLSSLFRDNPELQSLSQHFNKQQNDAWLVGGCLRDLLLSRPVVDIDIAAEKDPTAIAREWSHKVGGRWFWLDKERLQSRVLLRNQSVVDFTPLRAATIEDDLKKRDFTINALAVRLDASIPNRNFLDPTGGARDLERRVLNFCSEQSVSDDPLRMLKGVRHAVTLQMQLSDQARRQINQQAASISQVSGERIRDELGKILASNDPVGGLELLLECRLLEPLFGPAGGTWQPGQAMADLQRYEADLKALECDDDTAAPADPYNSHSLFLLATLLRAYAPANLDDLLHLRLRLSRHQQRIVQVLQAPPPAQWLELLAGAGSCRQKALLVEQLGYFPDEQLLYWSSYQGLIDQDRVKDLLTCFYEYQQLGRVPDLLTGHQLGEFLPGQPRTAIGLWLKNIKQAEIIGEIGSSEDASRWLEKQISN